jgi:5-dehydro-2-deoxygluconokinase
MKIDFIKEKELDIITLGRACIDLNAVEYNQAMEESMTFSKYVGGSPANIAIGSAKLGLRTGFIGKISDDQHGRFIKAYMKKMGVDTSQMVVDKEGRKVGLAFTEIKSPEECSILMYRENVADLYLQPSEIDETYIKKAKILLISGTALAQSPSREAVLMTIDVAKKHDVKIVFELDYRPYTWASLKETATYYTLVAQRADIVIGTREEYDMMEGLVENGENATTTRMLFKHDPELIIIKHGVKGSYAYTKSGATFKGYAYKTNVLKTFGAGDSYASALLFALLTGKDIEMALKYGGASASIVVSKHSSSEAMPVESEITALISHDETI